MKLDQLASVAEIRLKFQEVEHQFLAARAAGVLVVLPVGDVPGERAASR